MSSAWLERLHALSSAKHAVSEISEISETPPAPPQTGHFGDNGDFGKRINSETPPTNDGLADLDAEAEFEERAAIVQYAGGAPRSWAEGFARLDRSAPPEGFSQKQWERVIEDGGRFLDRWAREAIRLGWSAEDVFGVHPVAPGARLDVTGLVALIGGGEVISITSDCASIRMPGGGALTYLRRPRPGAVALWELRHPQVAKGEAT